MWRRLSCASDIRITCFTCVFVRCCTSLMSDSTLLLVAFVWPMSTATTTSNGEEHSKRSKMSALMVVAGPAMATKTAVCWPGACRSPEVVIAWQQQGRKGGGGDDKSSEELVEQERPSSEAE